MSCSWEKDRLSGYLDGELDPVELEETERHLGECAECRQELDEIRSVAGLVAGQQQLQAPRSIAEGVSREFGRGVAYPGTRRVLLWATAAAAALLIVLNVVYFTGIVQRPGEEGGVEPTLAKTQPPEKRKSGARDKGVSLAEEDAEVPGAAQVADEGFDSKPAEKPAVKNEGGERAPLKAKKGAPAPKPEPTQTEPALEMARRKAREAAPEPLTGRSRSGAPPVLGKAAPTAPVAEPEAAPNAPMAQKMLDPKAAAPKAAGGMSRMQEGAVEEKKDLDEAPLRFTVVSKSGAEARKAVEAILEKLGPRSEDAKKNALKPGQKESQSPPSFLSVRLTDAQIAALKKDVEKGGQVLLVAGTLKLSEAHSSLKKTDAPPVENQKAPDTDRYKDAPEAEALAKKAEDALRAVERGQAKAAPARLVEIHFLEISADAAVESKK
jgi:hypothetical protein